MKTYSLLAYFLLISLVTFGQSKSIDEMFSKFENKEGITSVNISKDLMGLVAQMDSNDVKCKNFISQITQIKVLVLEHASAEEKNNFNSMAKSLPLSEYKELMVIRENNQNIKMLLRENQGRVSEFLLLVTGEKEPVLIRILGNIDPKELGKLANTMHMNGFQHFGQLDKNKKKG